MEDGGGLSHGNMDGDDSGTRGSGSGTACSTPWACAREWLGEVDGGAFVDENNGDAGGGDDHTTMNAMEGTYEVHRERGFRRGTCSLAAGEGGRCVR